MKTNASKTLLIVDDMADNLKLLFRYLSNLKYHVRVAKDGLDALEQVIYAKPDLILLDIMMPKLDGFETCRRLKANPETQEIPVIFMSALSDTVDKITGFEVGGVDYITKPFQYEEVMARVNTHLTLSELRHSLAEKNVQLQQQNRELDAYSYTVAHDLKTPMNSLNMSLDTLKDHLQTIGYELDGKTLKYMGFIEQSTNKMKGIVEALLLLGQTRHQHKVQMQNLQMANIFSQAQQRLRSVLEENQVSIGLPKKWISAWGYPQWIEEVWTNYLSNAIKYGGTPPILQVGCEYWNEKHVRFWVKDNGNGIDEEEQKKLFVPFTRINQVCAGGHGLGLSIVQRIIEKCEGEVGLESQPGQGSTFYFTLPIAH